VHLVRDDDEALPAPLMRELGSRSGLAASLVRVRIQAHDLDTGLRTERFGLGKVWQPVNHERGREAIVEEAEGGRETLTSVAGEHDDRVCVRRSVYLRIKDGPER
jgi:hypothetical protein